MFELALDWEGKIENLCEKYGVHTDHYNQNNEFKETIAKALGFSSFETFQQFPNPSLIVDGMGNPLIPEYLTFLPALLDDCCKIIQKRWIYKQDPNKKLKQTNELLLYIISNNIPNEIVLATIQRMIDHYDLPCQQATIWPKVLEQHGDLLAIL